MDAKREILAFGAHPDDVELGVGAILIKMVAAGHRAVIVDLTRGELATGGDPETRFKEAQEAAKIMGVEREILNLGDCRLMDSFENRLVLVEKIRYYRPKVVLAPYHQGLVGGQGHPDHRATGILATHAVRLAQFKKVLPDKLPHQVKGLLYYGLPRDLLPTFVVDITPYYQRWAQAVRAHQSQFLNPEKPRDYLGLIESSIRGYGALAEVKYAQGLLAQKPLLLTDIVEIFE